MADFRSNTQWQTLTEGFPGNWSIGFGCVAEVCALPEPSSCSKGSKPGAARGQLGSAVVLNSSLWSSLRRAPAPSGINSIRLWQIQTQVFRSAEQRKGHHAAETRTCRLTLIVRQLCTNRSCFCAFLTVSAIWLIWLWLVKRELFTNCLFL